MSLSTEQRDALAARAQRSEGLVGSWRAKRAVNALGAAFRAEPDRPLAAELLALACGEQPAAATARAALLGGAREAAGAAVLADRWHEQRDPLIVELLQEADADVGTTPERLPLRFALGRAPGALSELDDDQLDAAIACAHDADAAIAQAAGELLLQAATEAGALDAERAARVLAEVSRSPAGVQRLVDAWSERRESLLLDVLRDEHADIDPAPARNVPALLALDRLPAGLAGFEAEHADALVAALEDADAAIAERAADVLRTTACQEAVDALAHAWAATGRADLDELVRANRALPTDPDHALWVSIAQGRSDVAEAAGTEGVDALLAIAADRETLLMEDAADVLAALGDPACQAHVCERALQGDPHAREAAIAAGYLPEGDPQRAGFLLLTEQWDRYGELDFDGRLIATFYAGASGELQARLRELARRSGRTQILRMMLGGNRRDRVRQLTRPEADYLAESLLAQGQHEEAWKLVFELPFTWGLSVAAKLQDLGWEPGRPDDRALQHALAEAHRRGDAKQVSKLGSILPLAIKRADARISGGATAVAFAPDAMELAIGTNARRVGLWDLQHAQLLWHQEVDRAVGHIVHAGGGELFAAERTNALENWCSVYAVARDGVEPLGEHLGSINGLGLLPDGAVMTAGRDGYLRFWADGDRPDIRVETPFGDDWPRAIAVSAHDGHVASVHRGVTLVDVPSARVMGVTDFPSTASAAAFAPDGEHLIVGMHNGLVHVCRRSGAQLRIVRRLGAHGGKVVSIVSVPDRSLVVIGSVDGCVRAHAWPSGNLVGELDVGTLRSVTVSPHGDWLALGHEQLTSLWDFRVADIPGLFALPLVDTTPGHLGLLETAVAGLAAPARPSCLETIAAMLRHRFRHDVQIAEAPVAIRAGTFDIELG